MKKLIIQALKFFGVSGIGWLMDMAIFSILTFFSLSEVIANIISSFVAITFVYSVSTKKLFQNKDRSLDLKKKYILYILYQVVIVSLSSLTIGWIVSLIEKNITWSLLLKFSKITAKILVTPFTMVLNFLFMKFLIERV